jgi:threonine synthase
LSWGWLKTNPSVFSVRRLLAARLFPLPLKAVQKPSTIARSLAIGNPADGIYAARAIRQSGGWAEDVSDVELVSGIRELAEAEGIFTETAGGVTTSVTARLYAHGRIRPEELTVTCITGNGLKTTDALAGCFEQREIVRPRLTDFENYIDRNQFATELVGRR